MTALRLGLEIVARQQLGLGKAPGEIEQDRRDLGQRAAVDHKRRDLALRIEREIAGRLHVVAPERHRPGFEADTDLVQGDMDGHRARARCEVQREHGGPLLAR
nr:hypothetical protein [Bradyrhizobium tropiciagri]